MVIVFRPLAADQYGPFQHFLPGLGNGKSLSLSLCAVHKEEQTAYDTKPSNAQTDGLRTHKRHHHP